jgi:hypothetical protein
VVVTDEPITVFDDDDLGDPPDDGTADDLTFEELEALANDALDPTSPSPSEVN